MGIGANEAALELTLSGTEEDLAKLSQAVERPFQLTAELRPRPHRRPGGGVAHPRWRCARALLFAGPGLANLLFVLRHVLTWSRKRSIERQEAFHEPAGCLFNAQRAGPSGRVVTGRTRLEPAT
jgi:hypothetical protein